MSDTNPTMASPEALEQNLLADIRTASAEHDRQQAEAREANARLGNVLRTWALTQAPSIGSRFTWTAWPQGRWQIANVFGEMTLDGAPRARMVCRLVKKDGTTGERTTDWIAVADLGLVTIEPPAVVVDLMAALKASLGVPHA